MRYRLWALLAVLIVTPALAQMNVQRIKPIVIQPIVATPPSVDTVVEPWMTPESAKKAIEQLRAERSELKTSLSETNTRLAEAIARIDEMTKPTGSLVRAYCASPTLSRNTAGAEEDCAAGGYGCDQVSGLCHRTATNSLMCSSGFNWDARTNQCVR